MQMTLQIPIMKTLQDFFNQDNEIWRCKNASLNIIYFIKYFRGGFGKIKSEVSSTSAYTYSITVFSPVLPLNDKGILPVTAPLTCSVLILGNVSNENPLTPVDDPNCKPPGRRVL